MEYVLDCRPADIQSLVDGPSTINLDLYINLDQIDYSKKKKKKMILQIFPSSNDANNGTHHLVSVFPGRSSKHMPLLPSATNDQFKGQEAVRFPA